MMTVLASHGELDGVTWYDTDPRCLVQWGRATKSGAIVGRQPYGKGTLLHVEREEVLDELLDACKAEIVIIAEGTLEELGGDPTIVPTIAGGALASKLRGDCGSLKKTAGKVQGKTDAASLTTADRAAAAELVAECAKAEPLEEKPADDKPIDEKTEPTETEQRREP